MILILALALSVLSPTLDFDLDDWDAGTWTSIVLPPKPTNPGEVGSCARCGIESDTVFCPIAPSTCQFTVRANPASLNCQYSKPCDGGQGIVGWPDGSITVIYVTKNCNCDCP